MKLVHKLILVMLCFCMVSSASSQEHETVISQTNMANWHAASVNPGNQAVDSLAQYFYWPGGDMHSISCLPMDPLSISDRPGRLTLTYGSPYGEVAWEKDTLFAGLGRFISDQEASGILTPANASATWINTVCQHINYDSAGWRFREVAMDFVIDEYFPPGNMTLIMSISSLDSNFFANGASRAPFLITYGNCPYDMTCAPEYVLMDPYEDGYLMNGGGFGQDGTHYPLAEYLGYDMAFEVVKLSDHTGTPQTTMKPSFNWNGKIEIYDLSGRLVAKDIDYLANAQGIHVVRSGDLRKKVLAPFRP